jgi:intracellular multiplication protein IcmP
MGFNLIVLAIGIGLGGYLLWTNFHRTISAIVMQVMHHEIGVLGYFTNRFALADRQMTAADPSGVALRDLYGILHAVGLYVKIPAVALTTVLAVLCMARAAPSRFRRNLDLNGLLREQVRYFPAAHAFVRRHLSLTPPAEGTPRPADYALTPEEWIDRFAASRDGSVDEGRAIAALTRQLGPRWQGVDAAAPVVRVLFAAFALHMVERRDDAIALLGEISASLDATTGEGPTGPVTHLRLPEAAVKQADALLADRSMFSAAEQAAARHAYTAPALMTVLNIARLRAGVLAPAQFAWLKLVDRPLWYALQSLGFESEGIGRYLHPNARVEAAGARDHWASERAAGQPITWPCVERALHSLRQFRGVKAALQPHA